jgi:hypothetical protein
LPAAVRAPVLEAARPAALASRLSPADRFGWDASAFILARLWRKNSKPP